MRPFQTHLVLADRDLGNGSLVEPDIHFPDIRSVHENAINKLRGIDADAFLKFYPIECTMLENRVGNIQFAEITTPEHTVIEAAARNICFAEIVIVENRFIYSRADEGEIFHTASGKFT